MRARRGAHKVFRRGACKLACKVACRGAHKVVHHYLSLVTIGCP